MTDLSRIKDRVVGLEWLDVSEIDDHTGNWRDHPQEQVNALAGVLAEVGVADTLTAYHSERNGGRLTLIDGHLRKGLARRKWPVVVLDVNDAEADYLLATLDPLAAMAQTDPVALDALLDSINSGEAGVQAMLAELAKDAGLFVPDTSPTQSFEDYTDEDVEKEAERLEGKFSGPNGEQLEMLCPECGHEFFVNKSDVLKDD